MKIIKDNVEIYNRSLERDTGISTHRLQRSLWRFYNSHFSRQIYIKTTPVENTQLSVVHKIWAKEHVTAFFDVYAMG